MVLYQGRSYKAYRGMGSVEAMRAGSSDRYFQDGAEEGGGKLVPEGVGRVPYKGPLKDQLSADGLRAAMGYTDVGIFRRCTPMRALFALPLQG